MYVLLTTNSEYLHRNVSYGQIAKEMLQFQNLMASLMENHPQFFITSNNKFMDSKVYESALEMLQKKLKDLENELMVSR